jgi:hypothetical protein
MTTRPLSPNSPRRLACTGGLALMALTLLAAGCGGSAR